MADDKTFEIKILQTSEGTAIQDSTEGLSNLTKVTSQSGDANTATKQTVEKLTASHHELREIAHGLRMEFPLLGEAAHLAFNPVVLSAAAIGYSLKVIFDKLKDIGSVMENVGFRTEEINAAATAWNKYAEEVSKVSVNTTLLATNLANISY